LLGKHSDPLLCLSVEPFYFFCVGRTPNGLNELVLSLVLPKYLYADYPTIILLLAYEHDSK
jgi:hypothetical protein